MTLNIQSSAYSNFFQTVGVKKADDSKAPETQQQPIASVKISDVEPKKKGIKDHLGQLSVGGLVILGVIGAACLSKGASGGLYKRMKKFTADLNRKTYDLKADYKNLTLQQKIKLKFAQGIKPFAVALEASSNLNVFKDGFTLWSMDKLHLKPVADGINKFFKKIVMKSEAASYRRAEMSSVQFCNYLENLSKNPKASGLNSLGDNISNAYSQSFSTQHYVKRSENMWETLSGLHKKVWNSFNIFKKDKNMFLKENREQWKTYKTMDMCADERNAVHDVIRAQKKLISNNISDNHNNLTSAFDNLKIHVDPKDKNAVKLMQELSEQIEKYSKLGGKNEEAQRQALSESLNGTLNRLKSQLRTNSTASIDAEMKKIAQILDPNATKKGHVQEALTKVKEIYGKDSKEYKQAKKYADELNINLNKAISTEMTAYEKLAELQMGSAPTDIIGILFPAALGVGLVINAKDKDQRIKNTLTLGIPIIGGVATAYYGTTRMLTGPTNMALGILSTMLLNLVGTKVDDGLKSYKEKQASMKKEYDSLRLAQKELKEIQSKEPQKIITA